MDISVAVNNFGDTRSGGLGLFVIVLMSLATVLLIRNMNKRLRRLPDSFADAKQTQREAEIARLNADLARSGAAEGVPDSDASRSSAAGAAAEGEVTGITTQSDDGSADGDARRV